MGIDRYFEARDEERNREIRKLEERIKELTESLEEVETYLIEELRFPVTGSDLPNPLDRVREVLKHK